MLNCHSYCRKMKGHLLSIKGGACLHSFFGTHLQNLGLQTLVQQPYQRNQASATPLHSTVQGASSTSPPSQFHLRGWHMTRQFVARACVTLGLKPHPSTLFPFTSGSSSTPQLPDPSHSRPGLLPWDGLLQGTGQVSLQDKPVCKVSVCKTCMQ